jgi:hypothetical protein
MGAREPTIEERRAELHYQRERLALYRSRLYAQRTTSLSRLRELERAAEGAESRLRAAERAESRLRDAERGAASSAPEP